MNNLLKENSRMIKKAESKIAESIDAEYWEQELEILQNERMMIEDGTWQ